MKFMIVFDDKRTTWIYFRCFIL